MWEVFRRLAPSVALPANYDNLKTSHPYPFSIPVDKKVTPKDMTSVLRDWYEGTEFSTGSGLAAGPFGTPDRYSGGAGEAVVPGNWERTITLFRTSDSYVIQSRSWLPDALGGVVWFGPHAAHGTVYVPLMAGMLTSPDCLAYGWQGVYNLTTSYWAHRVVENLAQIKFNYIIEDIRQLQNSLESDSQTLIDTLSKKYANSELSQDELFKITKVLSANAQRAVISFIELFHSILFKYADGNINAWNKDTGIFTSYSTGYPSWWLESVGYTEGPPPAGTPIKK
jgi:dipeptidase